MLVHGELLTQGQVLEGEVAVAAEEEREETKQVEQEGDHRVGIFSDQSRQINHLPPDGVLAKDRADPPRRNLKGIPVRAVHIGTPHIETVASWLLWGAGGRD